DLAVLSACNTGSGQLVKGDGVLSLSKGFVHAGCPSAVMSLWSVDDFSTSEIMIDFYDYLKKGYTKDEALRKAKLDFIASADKVKKHPFFWAAFVQMGDPVALDLGQVRIPWNLLIVISTLAVIGGYIIRRRSLAA
ncbi:MAG: CHAT domain-containing protein, partial [Cyanothece sp. SIO1E1]|nr:CHAT domain-containing protein [Cyanothece sp. SIO1E1]